MLLVRLGNLVHPQRASIDADARRPLPFPAHSRKPAPTVLLRGASPLSTMDSHDEEGGNNIRRPPGADQTPSLLRMLEGAKPLRIHLPLPEGRGQGDGPPRRDKLCPTRARGKVEVRGRWQDRRIEYRVIRLRLAVDVERLVVGDEPGLPFQVVPYRPGQREHAAVRHSIVKLEGEAAGRDPLVDLCG